MIPLPFRELQARAEANRSVNTHLATPWNLRWHDPFFIAAWERFNAAQVAWNRAWKRLDWKYLRGTDHPDPARAHATLWPDVTVIPAGPEHDAAVEYLAAKAAYLASWDHYPDERPEDSAHDSP